jgi:serine phosphatase RsbU (regulator of sigma subunit)
MTADRGVVADGANSRRRFTIAYAGLAIVVIVAVAFLVNTVRSYDRASRQEDELWRPGQVAARDLFAYAVDQETGQRGYVLTGDRQFLAPYTEGKTGSDAAISTLESVFASDSQLSGLVEQVGADLSNWRSQAAQPEIAAADISLAQARAMVAEGNGKVLFDQFRTDLKQLVAVVDARSAVVTSQRNTAFRAVVVTAAIAIATIIASALLILYLSRRWIGQLRVAQQRLRDTIATLQLGLLPNEVPQLDNVAVAVAYLPATDDLEVGGDFYDISTPSEGSVAITVGDVCGHDVDAAVITGLVRNTISAASAHLEDPSEVLDWANRALRHRSRDTRYVTVAQAHLDHTSNTLRLALAGHPPPILIPANGDPPHEIGASGTLLGVLASPTITTVEVPLKDGDQVLFYTDGLTENTRPRLATEELLALVARSSASTAIETKANLLDNYHAYELGESRDDVAIVVVQLVAEDVPTRG